MGRISDLPIWSPRIKYHVISPKILVSSGRSSLENDCNRQESDIDMGTRLMRFNLPCHPELGHRKAIFQLISRATHVRFDIALPLFGMGAGPREVYRANCEKSLPVWWALLALVALLAL